MRESLVPWPSGVKSGRSEAYFLSTAIARWRVTTPARRQFLDRERQLVEPRLQSFSVRAFEAAEVDDVRRSVNDTVLATFVVALAAAALSRVRYSPPLARP